MTNELADQLFRNIRERDMLLAELAEGNQTSIEQICSECRDNADEIRIRCAEQWDEYRMGERNIMQAYTLKANEIAALWDLEHEPCYGGGE